jgi:hypothetical protein
MAVAKVAECASFQSYGRESFAASLQTLQAGLLLQLCGNRQTEKSLIKRIFLCEFIDLLEEVFLNLQFDNGRHWCMASGAGCCTFLYIN